jgi:hypothetical protein
MVRSARRWRDRRLFVRDRSAIPRVAAIGVFRGSKVTRVGRSRA